MGKLIDGTWHDVWYDTSKSGGRFVRGESSFRDWIVAAGRQAPSDGERKRKAFPAERGRYHLFVSYACPWAHRTLVLRALKGLQDAIGVSVVNPYMGQNGWTFAPGEGVVADPVMNAQYLHQLYTRAAPRCTGRVTVPVLWDKQDNIIVSNESSEIIRMFNDAFDDLGAVPGDYYPAALRADIDEVNARVYEHVNNGVYRCGFATTQTAYEEAYASLFETLDWIEARLGKQRYLVGTQLTEADIRLFTTLVRFDAVYYSHFKTNKKRLTDYPHLWAFTRDLYQRREITPTVHFDHIKQHYYRSHPTINPTGIVPVGPEIDFNAPHDRDRSP